jgi:hypothetical protein
MSAELLFGKRLPPTPEGQFKAIRFVILFGGASNQYTTIEEVRVFNEEGTKVSHSAGNVATASSVYPGYAVGGPVNGNYPTNNVLDMWCPQLANSPNTNRSCWWKLTFAQPTDIDRIEMGASQNYGRVPIDMDIEVSEDGTNFVVLAELRNLVNWVQGIARVLWTR